MIMCEISVVGLWHPLLHVDGTYPQQREERKKEKKSTKKAKKDSLRKKGRYRHGWKQGMYVLKGFGPARRKDDSFEKQMFKDVFLKIDVHRGVHCEVHCESTRDCLSICRNGVGARSFSID